MGAVYKISAVYVCLVYCFMCCTRCCGENTQMALDEVSIQFEDDWDYHVKPDSSPLLDEKQNNHLLPPAYTYDEDISVAGLNNEIRERKLLKSPSRIGDVIRAKVPCGVCKLGIGLLIKEVESDTAMSEIKVKFVSLCVSLKIETLIVCSGLFDTYGPEVVPALKYIQIGPSEICSLMFGEACESTEIPLHEWDLEFPEVSKPRVNVPPLPKVGQPTFKVLHLTDTHYDPDYQEGSPNNCEEPLCCRNYSTPLEGEPFVPAGMWGSYQKCDAPKVLLQNMLRHIVDQHPDIDYIIWTGDIPPHDIWNQTKQYNLDIMRDTVQMILGAFPNTPIFPAVGNHESSPAGNFPPPWMKHENHSISWLYNEMASHWTKWLPPSANNSVLHGAFYSVLLRPGFRLISINTNYCHTLSWWLYVNSTDPASELKWLIYQLQQAENNGEKVHIIGHIAPGSSDCMKQWSSAFYTIVDRYENTITGQFYGHSHADEFEVFYETQEYSRPTGVAYIGPSVTTYEDFNPAYRIYYVDGDHPDTTLEIVEHETWTMDLDKANLLNEDPIWFKLYTARDAYQMVSLRPNEWSKLIDRMIGNDDLFELFYRLYYRGNPKRPFCDEKCKLQILCDLKSGKSQSRRELCHELGLTV